MKKLFNIIGIIFGIINIASCSNDVLVKINTEKIINTVSDKFISFSIDPGLIINRGNSKLSEECVCMINSLSPAYIRISGLSTQNITIKDSNVKLNGDFSNKVTEKSIVDDQKTESDTGIQNTLTLEKWKNFLRWLRLANFTPVVALDNAPRFACGNWNPKIAIQALSIVDQSNIGECVWQLGNECKNQTMQKYLSDLKVLKILTDAFSSGKSGKWKILSADISKCVESEESQSFKTLLPDANTFLDALILNSNDTSDVLNIFSEEEKKNTQRHVSKNSTQLWKTVDTDDNEEDAMIWLKNLGEAAQQGYSVVFKELYPKEMKEMTMSFFVSLLHKKFVGQQVLEVSTDSEQSGNVSVFAHCATLPYGPISNGITLFGTNEGDTFGTAIIKVAMKTGGEIMQFVIQKNNESTIIINGIEITNESNIIPDVQIAPPFKAIKIMMPPKSIGFWILPNADVKICSNQLEENQYKQIKLERTAEMNSNRNKRSVKELHLEKPEGTYDDKLNELLQRENFTDLNSDDLKVFLSNGSELKYKEISGMLGQLQSMLQLEREFLEIGDEMLKLNSQSPNGLGEERDLFLSDDQEGFDFGNEFKKDTPSYLIAHKRVIRDMDMNLDSLENDNEDIPDNIKASTEHIEKVSIPKKEDDDNNEEVQVKPSTKFSPLKIPKLKLPDIKLHKLKHKNTMDELLERARSAVKKLDSSGSESMKSVSVLPPPKLKSSLHSLDKVDFKAKDELLKQQSKMKELQLKLKARIAELNLKNKIDLALPHKLFKRDILGSIDIENDIKQRKMENRELNGYKKNNGIRTSKKFMDMKKIDTYMRKKRSLVTLDMNEDMEYDFPNEIENVYEFKNNGMKETNILNLNNEKQSENVENLSKKTIKNKESTADESLQNSITKSKMNSEERKGIEMHTLEDNIRDASISVAALGDDLEELGTSSSNTFSSIIENVNELFSGIKNKFMDLWNSFNL